MNSCLIFEDSRFRSCFNKPDNLNTKINSTLKVNNALLALRHFSIKRTGSHFFRILFIHPSSITSLREYRRVSNEVVNASYFFEGVLNEKFIKIKIKLIRNKQKLADQRDN